MEKTYIQIDVDVRDELTKLKIIERDSYNAVIKRLIEKHNG